MKFYYQSINNKRNEWVAYKIRIREMQEKKPSLHLQICGQNFFKLMYENHTIFWAKQHARYYAVAILKTFNYNSIFSPISSQDVEKRKSLVQDKALASWSQYFLNELKGKTEEVLYNGTWILTPYVASDNTAYTALHNGIGFHAIYGVENSLSASHFQNIPWFFGSENLVNLKKINLYSGRLKWWRKKAQENALPPILLLYISGLDNYIILDGHYRLKAAYLEKVKVECLVLHRSQKNEIVWNNEKQKADILKNIDGKNFGIHKQNELLIKAYTNKVIEYNLASRTFGFSQNNDIQDIAEYLHKLGKLALIEQFFKGEWKEI
ncbi:MAG: Unknown protein [uncultured Sulfurovum sp.]|uniref:ParB/Sulfiredoxin domain-containing protein n=1 Tax=uncultured Sulfurovum sp. TaxID=269237 RepID=A0A6S6TUT0_9BACT|nr:MAG: Unknown protein [uncultured Sulfurovum sp.]